MVLLQRPYLGVATTLFGKTVNGSQSGFNRCDRRDPVSICGLADGFAVASCLSPHRGVDDETDVALRDEIDGVLREAAASGATVILASHERERSGSLATRSVTVEGGAVKGGLL